ncbi:hypothetical protein AGMMS50268_40630 [Spirochaetia bacterium]|nr:hypothetical protein AGMMS50268_40630 [Spirochaetia bacterium]
MINKRIAMILGLIALAALPLAAQDIQAPPSIGAPKSTTKTATADRIGTDVDNFLDYTGHTGVKFDNWFGYAGYESLASVGYARKLGSIYLGAWYKGNVARTQAVSGLSWSGPGSTSIIGNGININLNDLINPVYDAFGELQSTTKSTGQDNADGIVTDNQLQALIGFGNMAVKVGFREFLYSQPDYTNIYGANQNQTMTTPGSGTVAYANALESFSDLHGNLQPNVGWGAAFALGKFTLKPKAEVAIAIVQDARETVVKDGTSVYGNGAVTSKKSGYANNFVRPSITVGADIALQGKNGGTWTPGIAYNIFFDVYSNDYDAYGSSGTVKGTVNYTASDTISGNESTHVVTVSPISTVVTDTAKIRVVEKSAVYNVITPGISYSDNFGDRVKFGFKAQVPVHFGSRTESSYSETTAKTDTKYTSGTSTHQTQVTRQNQQETVTSQFRISPKIDVGTSYQVIPGKLALNAGVSGTFGYRSTEARQTPNGYYVQTTYTTDENGNVTTNNKTVNVDSTVNDQVTKVYAWDAFTPTFGAGLTINFTETFALDTSFQTGATVNLGSVQLLLSLKK